MASRNEASTAQNRLRAENLEERCLFAAWQGQSGNFETATNWDTNVVPGANDTAEFSAVGNYTVKLVAPENVKELDSRTGNPSLDFNGNTLTFGDGGLKVVDGGIALQNTAEATGTLEGDAPVSVGTAGAATLSVASNTFLNVTDAISIGSASNGTVVLAGGHASFTSATIGDLGQGNLEVLGAGARFGVGGPIQIGVGARGEVHVKTTAGS